MASRSFQRGVVLVAGRRCHAPAVFSSHRFRKPAPPWRRGGLTVPFVAEIAVDEVGAVADALAEPRPDLFQTRQLALALEPVKVLFAIFSFSSTSGTV
jgi:hypothetical protein